MVDDASPRFISSCCAFYARNVYVDANLSPDELQSGYWTDTKDGIDLLFFLPDVVVCKFACSHTLSMPRCTNLQAA